MKYLQKNLKFNKNRYYNEWVDKGKSGSRLNSLDGLVIWLDCNIKKVKKAKTGEDQEKCRAT